MTRAACYVLNLRCDHERHDRLWLIEAQFTGRNEREALSAASKAGWLARRFADFCPICMDKYESPSKGSEEQAS